MWNKDTKSILIYGVAFNSFRMLVGAIATVYILHNGLSLTDVSLLKSMQAIIILFLDLPLSYVADKYSRKFSVQVAVFFGALWLFIMGIADSKPLFYLAEIMNALSLTFFNGAFISYLIDNTKKASNSGSHNIIATYNQYQFFAMAIFSFIGAFFINIDFRGIWFIASGLCFILFIIFWIVLPKDYNHEESKPKRSFIQDLIKIKDIMMSDSKIILIIAIMMCIIASYYQVLIQYWQPFAFYLYDELPKDGHYYAVAFLFILLGQSFVSYLMKKVNDVRKSILLGFIISILALTLIYVSQYFGAIYMVISIIVMFAGNRAMYSALQSLFHDNIESALRSTLDSIISTMTRIFIIAILPLIGFALNAIGWNIMTLFFVISILSSIFILKVIKQVA